MNGVISSGSTVELKRLKGTPLRSIRNLVKINPLSPLGHIHEDQLSIELSIKKYILCECDIVKVKFSKSQTESFDEVILCPNPTLESSINPKKIYKIHFFKIL